MYWPISQLAFRLASRGFKVGLFDADVHGPSLPTQLPESINKQKVEFVGSGWAVKPFEHAGVKLMSFGWVSKMWTTADGEVRSGFSSGDLTTMLLHSTSWGNLDYLVVDSPPGTGEILHALYTTVPLHGAVVVTTPSPLATVDVVRGIKMLARLKVPVLALVENMASFQCGSCSATHFPFGRGHINEVLSSWNSSTANSGLSSPPEVISLPIITDSSKPITSSNLASGLRPPSGLEPHFDQLIDALERRTAGAKPVELHKQLDFHQRAHWPTVISMTS